MALISSKTLVANRRGATRNNPPISPAQYSSITGTEVLARRSGGPPLRSQLLMVLG